MACAATVARGAEPATAPVASADVPVRAVVLYSSGVGYFEHFGTVHGDGSTELRFKTGQINDILKSLVLQDLDGGTVGSVTYPSQDPLAKTLKSFQVDITGNPPLADLLNQLRGASVALTNDNGEALAGTILGVEIHKKAVGDKGDIIEQPFLNLLNDGSITSVSMEGVKSIKLDDPQLQEELNKALAALAGARDQDKKPVTIHFSGQGDRRVRIGYVVETPIWKTSYRLILAETPAAAGKPAATDGKLQGWAIVENQTDNDWNNVELTLVSGRPISFIEDLYQPLYVPRPVVEPDLYASLRPQAYAPGMGSAPMAEAPALGSAENVDAAKQLNGQLQMNRFALQQAESRRGGGGGGGGNEFGNAGPMDVTSSVRSLASASEVGELFQYTVGNVSLARQRSAMIPIITDPIEVQRVSIYNQSVLPRNPLNGASIDNTTGKHLLAGPVTVIDGGAYAGDAQIDNVPPGQRRLLSYGVDLQMLVDATDNHQDTQIQSGKIVKGVLVVSNKNVQSQNYVAENKSDHDKTLIIEHPRFAGWDLVDTAKPTETTDSVYRFTETVPNGKKVAMKVTQQMVEDQEVAILPAEADALAVYRTSGAIPKPVQDALTKAVQLKQDLVDTQRQLDECKAKLADITNEQNRIRENMRTVDKSSQYYSRLMKKLDDQETLIEKTQDEQDQLQSKLNDQRTTLEGYLQSLNVGA